MADPLEPIRKLIERWRKTIDSLNAGYDSTGAGYDDVKSELLEDCADELSTVLKSLEQELRQEVERWCKAAVQAERQACAQVCDRFATQNHEAKAAMIRRTGIDEGWMGLESAEHEAEALAARIRSRGPSDALEKAMAEAEKRGYERAAGLITPP